MFRMMDADASGRLDFNELMVGLSMCMHATPEVRAKFYFQVYDTNQDGTIDCDELHALLVPPPAPPRFAEIHTRDT
jgi:Ca2+-binding EF-hand superfamily protein